MIKIYTFAVNRPDFLEYQFKTFKHFLKDEHRLVVINDGHDSTHESVRLTAAQLGLECHSVPNPRRDTANYGHAQSIRFAYDNFIHRDDDVSAMIDGDMFMARGFSIKKWLGEYPLSALAQSRAHVEYMWPGIVFFNPPALPNKEKLDFWPDIVDGQGTDVGGHTYLYLRDNPSVKVKWMRHSGQIMECNKNLFNLPETALAKYNSDFHIEIFLSTFVHYAAGTNWYYKSPEFHQRKWEFVKGFLEDCIAGKENVPVTWPEHVCD